MGRNSKIEWCDDTWNIITGCTLVDEGCRHCYAAHLITSWPAIGNHPSRKGLARKNAAGESKFTGEVRFNEQWLDQPLRWKKPRKIFVCAHGDLFHPAVPDDWIDRVFAVMALCPQHTFQVLTKRPERARGYFDARRDGDPWAEAADEVADLIGLADHPVVLNPSVIPLPNVWLGTSISDQASADLRIPELLATPAAIHFISAEPLLGPVDLKATRYGHMTAISRLDWTIVGGESGPHARPMHPDWARSIRDQCAAAGVAFLFKQWGEWGPDAGPKPNGRDPVMEAKHPCAYYKDGAWQVRANGYAVKLDESAGCGQWVYRQGKQANGRLLDGVTHDGFPGVQG